MRCGPSSPRNVDFISHLPILVCTQMLCFVQMQGGTCMLSEGTSLFCSCLLMLCSDVTFCCCLFYAAFQSVTLCHLLVWLFDHSLLPFDHWMLPFYVAIGPLDRSVMDAALSPLGTAFRSQGAAL